MSVNKVILLGNIGQDVEIINLESGRTLTKFTMATNEVYKNQSGEKVTDTEWHNVVVWGKMGEVIQNYFKKGDQIYIEGKKKTQKWEDKEGNTRYNVNIEAKEFSFVGYNNNSMSDAKTKPESKQEQPNLGEDKDDLPF